MKVASIVRVYLREGRENAVDRYALTALTGLRDRQIREEIANISQTEVPIINLDGDGYFVPTEEDIYSVAKVYYRELARAKSVLKRVSVYKRWLDSFDYFAKQEEQKNG